MRINTNVSALNAYRNLTGTESALSRSMQRLSSGFRINRAADDAAGLGIANQLRANTRALTQASRNAEQANSVLQITEGATSTIQSMLERMKELATQAGSDSVDEAGRGRIDAEFDALRNEITRTVSTTKFQGQALLDGTFGDPGATLEVGDIDLTGSTAGAGTYSLSVDSSTGALTVSGPSGFTEATVALSAATYDSTAGTLTFAVSGLGDITVDATSATDVDSVVAGLDGRSFDVTAGASGTAATAGTATGAGVAVAADYSVTNATFDVSVDGGAASTITLNADYSGVGGLATMISDINTKLAAASIDASVADDGTGKLVWTQGTAGAASFAVTDTSGALGGDVTFAGTDAVAAGDPTVTSGSITGNDEQASFLVGSSGSYASNDLIKLSAINLSVSALGIDASDLSTAEGARTALTAIDSAMDTLNETLGDIGANQNRIDYAQENLRTTIQNFSAAESVIRDVDMAEEMTKFSKNQILQQAGTAMLAQANQLGQSVLQLLRG